MRPSRERILDSAHTQVARVDDLPTQPMAPDLEALFREAYLRLHGRLLDHAERFLDHDRACDVVDDALADLYQRWPQIPMPERSDGYAFRMVQNRIFDALKAADRRVSLDEVDEELEARGTPALDGDPTESDLAVILD